MLGLGFQPLCVCIVAPGTAGKEGGVVPGAEATAPPNILFLWQNQRQPQLRGIPGRCGRRA